MSPPSPSAVPSHTIRNRQYYEDDQGHQWTRRINPHDGSTTAWTACFPEPGHRDNLTDPLALSVVLQNQAPGEPRHWSLVVGVPNKPGLVYQVTGDATFMHYNHERDRNIWIEDETYTSYQVVGELDQDGQNRVGDAVNITPPPQAENRRAVTENCQGWVVRVLRKLQSQDVISADVVDKVEAMVEPVG
ncbi:hypothetical protein PG993_011659 [Apiospora rasikravindrae]|uniref:Uncharacterized protein n=1 Tax=Apiospora rasikravindrae TaxID=990691 RepID=A0ABR1S0E9_9PEZI